MSRQSLFIGILVVSLLIFIGLNLSPDQPTVSAPSRILDAPTPSLPTLPPPPYQIIGETQIGNTRCSFDVHLERSVLESEIRGIAQEIKGREVEECERTFIVHYLPGMEVGSGGWATSHFNPNLEVEVLGVIREKVNVSPDLPDGRVVGRWRRFGFAGGALTITRRGNEVIEQWVYDSGSVPSEKILSESRLPDGRMRYQDRSGSTRTDAYYVLGTDGRIQLCDGLGCFETLARD